MLFTDKFSKKIITAKTTKKFIVNGKCFAGVCPCLLFFIVEINTLFHIISSYQLYGLASILFHYIHSFMSEGDHLKYRLKQRC